MQFLSEKLSRHLTSLVPGFEGHWKYIEIKKCGCRVCRYTNANPHTQVLCLQEIAILEDDEYQEGNKIICPAWQVEDVLRNLKAIGEKLNWGWVCGDCGHERPRKAEPGDVRCDCDDPWYSWPQKYSNRAGEILAGYLHDHPDTYYQKIEKYLWSILK